MKTSSGVPPFSLICVFGITKIDTSHATPKRMFHIRSISDIRITKYNDEYKDILRCPTLQSEMLLSFFGIRIMCHRALLVIL